MALLKVYEYEVLDKRVGSYLGSYTLKENCPKEKELQKQFHSKLVQVFNPEDPQNEVL